MKKEQIELFKESLANKIDFVKKDYTLKILIYFLITVLIIFGILFLLLKKNINTIKFKNNLSNEISKIILRNTMNNQDNPEILFNGEVELKIFPFPHLVINDIVGKNLLQNNYKFDFNIKQVNLYISLKSILKNEVIVEKTEIKDSNFVLFELQNKNNNIILEKLFEGYSAYNNSTLLISKNNSMTINFISSKRELSDMNLNIILTQNKFNIVGKLKSNKQPLEVQLKFSKNKKGVLDANATLSSAAFNGTFDLNGDIRKHEYSGETNFRIDDLQIFSRTIFNQSNFIYQNVADNGNLKLKYSFSLQNDILKIPDITLKGANINANGSIIFNFNENQKNEINFNIIDINVDNLITKNLSSSEPVDEKEITIFNKNNEVENIVDNEYKTFLEKKFSINPTFFNLKFNSAIFNENTIKNTELNFSFLPNKEFNFTNVKSELPGGTNLVISKTDSQNKIILIGKNLGKFFSFLKNLKNTNIDKKWDSEFYFDGDLIAKGNKLFINNSSFKSSNLNSKNNIEVKFNNGIVFIAIKTEIESLNLDDFIQKKLTISQLDNMLKNKILFLNNFNLNTYINLHVDEMHYQNLKNTNCNLTIKTSQGVFNLDDINLEDKIKGKIHFNIMNKQPILDINLELNSIEFSNNIIFSKLIFDLPSLDDFYGNITILSKNFKFKGQTVDGLDFKSKITNGIINIENFAIDGFGGKCNISGFLGMQFNRKLNLSLNACTANIKNVLELTSNISNIEGLIGFSSILYAEGQNINLFNKNWILKTQLIGNGTIIKNYGLAKLNSELFNIQKDKKLLDNISSKDILFNKNEQTVFETLSGTLQHTITNGGQFDFDISRPFINGKLVGNFNFLRNSVDVNMNANFILLSGTLQNTVPLTLLSQIVGQTPNNLNISTNFQQIDDYIKSTRDSFNKVGAK